MTFKLSNSRKVWQGQKFNEFGKSAVITRLKGVNCGSYDFSFFIVISPAQHNFKNIVVNTA